MKVHICAMGRLRTGPEKTLCDDYAARFTKVGRALSLGPLLFKELDERKSTTPRTQTEALLKSVPKSALICALDERGEVLSSPKFSQKLEGWRDNGQQDVAFLIGGASGLDPNLSAQAQFALSFGKMVWPHMLARVMLSEQLYRAATLLAGTPYHKL